MTITETIIGGVFLIETRRRSDDRGAFVSVFHRDTFAAHGLTTAFVESYYSTSKRGVIRGMHFQVPPADHAKLVYVTRGAITDVVLDVRDGSPTLGRYVTLDLSAENRQSVYIPVGCAHGFLAREDDTSVTYLQTSRHSPEHDAGIRYDSFGFDWGVPLPTLSARDLGLPALTDFKTPFTL